jgi:predicted nucleic-acid-binding protein
MIAADTNVALRLILQDDEAQLALINAAISEQPLFLSLTVLLELGWVLASRYQMSRLAIADAVLALMLLRGIEFARAKDLRWAIDRFRAGADWADMIHLVSAGKLDVFVTLDQRLARQAGDRSPVPVETLR